jgi:hypothetical protein
VIVPLGINDSDSDGRCEAEDNEKRQRNLSVESRDALSFSINFSALLLIICDHIRDIIHDSNGFFLRHSVNAEIRSA